MRRSLSLSGFTLVELVVGILLAVLLAAILIPYLSHMGRTAGPSKRVHCMNNTRQIGLALKQYAIDHDDQFPFISNRMAQSGEVFMMLTNGGYLSISRIYNCRSDKRVLPPTSILTSSNNSYCCVSAQVDGMTPLTETNDVDTPLIFDRGPLKNGPLGTFTQWPANSAHGSDGGNVFYLGGQTMFRKSTIVGNSTNGYFLIP